MLLLWWPNQTFENKALFFENRSHNITREKNQYWQNLAQRKLTEKKNHHAIKIVFVKENHTKKENQFWVSAEKKSIFLMQVRIFWENVILLAGGEYVIVGKNCDFTMFQKGIVLWGVKWWDSLIIKLREMKKDFTKLVKHRVNEIMGEDFNIAIKSRLNYIRKR